MSAFGSPAGARCAFYARYSSANQSETSIEQQVEHCEQMRVRMQWQSAELYSDSAISGDSIIARPALLRLLEDVGAGKLDLVLCFTLDRFSRSQAEVAWLYEQLQFNRVNLYTVQDGLIGPMHIALKGYENANFRTTLAANTTRGQISAVKRGAIAGPCIYGLRLVRSAETPAGAREIHPAHAAIVLSIFEEVAAGRSPLSVCKELNRRGILSPRGKQWRVSTVVGSRTRGWGLLRNEIYRGWFVFRRTESRRVPGEGRYIREARSADQFIRMHHPHLQIIPDELWYAVQARLEESSRKEYRKSRRPVHLLTGRLFCGYCGSGFHVADGTSCACSGRLQKGLDCKNDRRIPRADIDEAVLRGVRDQIVRSDLLEPYIAEYRAEAARRSAALTAEIEGTTARLADLERQVEHIVVQIGDGKAEGPAGRILMDRLERLGEEREQLQRRATQPLAAPPPQISAAELAARLETQLATLAQQISGPRTEAIRAREILRSIIERVEITPVTDEGMVKGSRGPVLLMIHGLLPDLLALGDGRIVSVAPSGNLPFTQRDHKPIRFLIIVEMAEEFGDASLYSPRTPSSALSLHDVMLRNSSDPFAAQP